MTADCRRDPTPALVLSCSAINGIARCKSILSKPGKLLEEATPLILGTDSRIIKIGDWREMEKVSNAKDKRREYGSEDSRSQTHYPGLRSHKQTCLGPLNSNTGPMASPLGNRNANVRYKTLRAPCRYTSAAAASAMWYLYNQTASPVSDPFFSLFQSSKD